MLCLKLAEWVANSVDPDETPYSAASNLGLHYLLRPVCPITHGKYGSLLPLETICILSNKIITYRNYYDYGNYV